MTGGYLTPAWVTDDAIRIAEGGDPVDIDSLDPHEYPTIIPVRDAPAVSHEGVAPTPDDQPEDAGTAGHDLGGEG